MKMRLLGLSALLVVLMVGPVNAAHAYESFFIGYSSGHPGFKHRFDHRGDYYKGHHHKKKVVKYKSHHPKYNHFHSKRFGNHFRHNY